MHLRPLDAVCVPSGAGRPRQSAVLLPRGWRLLRRVDHRGGPVQHRCGPRGASAGHAGHHGTRQPLPKLHRGGRTLLQWRCPHRRCCARLRSGWIFGRAGGAEKHASGAGLGQRTAAKWRPGRPAVGADHRGRQCGLAGGASLGCRSCRHLAGDCCAGHTGLVRGRVSSRGRSHHQGLRSVWLVRVRDAEYQVPTRHLDTAGDHLGYV
mmetsp:Transcript_8304/g.31251  ORF Transcript_8304/g.31251 Transcript_8304/m.31251 type:complete len:208 (-) Transcript_8304:652-1275(-)